MLMKIKPSIVFLIVFLCVSGITTAQQKAFPTAEGFGQYTSGGRGGMVYTVTNLNDSGEGSLRKGILKKEPRIIVFAVSGIINLESPLDINHGNLTIAGQSAPEGGITLKGYPVSVKANNIIIRYLRFRMGDENKAEGDALGGRNLTDIMIDHCSISWATDENASFYWNKNFTMQWCIISEALNNSVHHKGNHGYGGIWGGYGASFHHNLIANNNSRNPRFSGSASVPNKPEELTDFRNNVIYNWGDNSIYGGEKGRYNIINNYFKPGPATPNSKKTRIVNPSKPYGKFYVDGNFVYGSKKVSDDNWQNGVQCDDPLQTKANEPFAINNNIVTQTPQQAYEAIIKQAGASLYRDAIDDRIVMLVEQQTAITKKGIIDSPADVGGYVEIKKVSGPKDTDEDGIPDDWEKAHQLDPEKDDASDFTISKDYTNLEVYLNSLIALTHKTSAYDYIVATDGTGNFTSLTALINALPDFRKNETKVFIKNGVYKEKLVLPQSKTNITFIGESKEETIITFDDYADKLNAFGEKMGTTGSSSFFIFGDHFKAFNITFENSAGPVGQAVAVRVDSDHASFENCKFLGNQDTVYLHGFHSKQYYKDCYIEGTVDFIFGSSTAVFNNCTIYSKSKGYVTAASTKEDVNTGMVFLNCKFKGCAPENSVYLGRPWRNYAQTVLINCYLDKHIKEEGWHNWNKQDAEQTVFYAEYNSTGPGAKGTRAAWAKSLSKKESENFSLKKLLEKQ